MSEGNTVIAGKKNIDRYGVLVLRSALRLEIDTGMKRSSRGPSTLAAVNKRFGTDFKRKQAALEYIEKEVIAKWDEKES